MCDVCCMLMRMWWRRCRWWERVAGTCWTGNALKAGRAMGVGGCVGVWAGGCVYSQLALSQSNRWQPHLGIDVDTDTDADADTSATAAVARSGPCELCAINLASFGGQLVTQCEKHLLQMPADTHTARHTTILSPHTHTNTHTHPKWKSAAKK